MAKHDHCIICDYTEAKGSALAGLRPGQNGKVRRHQDDLLCDRCITTVADAQSDFHKADKEDDDVHD